MTCDREQAATIATSSPGARARGMAQWEESRPFTFVRHGRSTGQPVMNPHTGRPFPRTIVRDDPLAQEGRAQAQAIRQQDLHLPTPRPQRTRVWVSPLSRALETACLLYGQLPAVLIVPTPALREFNEYQSPHKPLGLRHTGSPWSELQARFGHYSNILWPSSSSSSSHSHRDQEQSHWEGTEHTEDSKNTGGDSGETRGEEEEAWWSPHGALEECVQRMQQFAQQLWAHLQDPQEQATHHVVVCHENVFRILSGEKALTNCQPITCHLQRLLLTPHTHEASLPNSGLPHGPLLMRTSRRAQYLHQWKVEGSGRSVVCVVGQADEAWCRRHIDRALDRLEQEEASHLLFLATSHEYLFFSEQWKRFVATRVSEGRWDAPQVDRFRARVTIDPHTPLANAATVGADGNEKKDREGEEEGEEEEEGEPGSDALTTRWALAMGRLLSLELLTTSQDGDIQSEDGWHLEVVASPRAWDQWLALTQARAPALLPRMHRILEGSVSPETS